MSHACQGRVQSLEPPLVHSRVGRHNIADWLRKGVDATTAFAELIN